MTTKELEKNIATLPYYTLEDFNKDAKTYVEAIRTGRMICIVKSVSKSGMSRVLSFHSCEVGNERAWYRQYNCFFIALGYKESRSKEGFTVSGCGMDMTFATNYNIIHRLTSLDLLDKSECESMAQMTPTNF